MKVPHITLNDGQVMPQLGFGLWQVPDQQAEEMVLEAMKVGYRLLDSAQIYQNENGLGRTIKSSGLSRQDLYITTKIWNAEHGYDSTLKSFEASLKNLGLEYLDLLLIHWPAPKKGLFVDTWKALVQLQKDKRVRSIGVSNFNTDHLERIIEATSVTPVVNQIELHPRFQRADLRAFHEKAGIRTESWSPLGQGQLITDPVITKIAEKHQRTPAQIILRWHLDLGLIAIPKSVTPSRIKENFQVFDFRLDEEDHSLIAQLDDPNGRIGPDPLTANF